MSPTLSRHITNILFRDDHCRKQSEFLAEYLQTLRLPLHASSERQPPRELHAKETTIGATASTTILPVVGLQISARIQTRLHIAARAVLTSMFLASDDGAMNCTTSCRLAFALARRCTVTCWRVELLLAPGRHASYQLIIATEADLIEFSWLVFAPSPE